MPRNRKNPGNNPKERAVARRPGPAPPEPPQPDDPPNLDQPRRPNYNPRQRVLASKPGPAPPKPPQIDESDDSPSLDPFHPLALLGSNVEDQNVDELAQAMLAKLRGKYKMTLPMIRSLYLWQIHHNTKLSPASAELDRKLFATIVDIVERLLIEKLTGKKKLTNGNFENRLQRPDLDDGRGGKKTAASVVLTACRKIQQRLSSRRGNRGRPRTLGPQGPTAVERAADTVMRWTGGTVDTNRVVEEAWKARWLKERDGRAITRPADDFDHQQETLFRNETLRRHDGLSKAKSSLLIQIQTGAIGLRGFLFTRGVPEVLTPACECGEGRETAEHLVVWCLAPPLTRRWGRTGIRTRRDFYSALHGINPRTARLARRVLDWLMDSGKLPMYNLARRLELEAAA
ncbi:predicted protein [Chaetomium globosum CBS 148.51]|uniref:Reverse transcriptase n=1 Tax=Chaetomium globosum (strain ATCC 6205 / CBS 148.51 / DSM 1962 / NBRC 6347 / NRRL 1970) TaxID=306901 RepID=Q2H5A3_CHAGB|nr:uncharacterized protein CHGG_06162 [Chaetomium globosum CBS 148.51]EAQ89543.1 predicted protein [Chaetomium globosum CBS 148.51]